MNFDLQRRRFYGILDLGYVSPADSASVATQMLEGGVQILQLRAKEIPLPVILRVALTLLPICRRFGVPFIINDHPDIVSKCDADGLHIGQDDITVEEARGLIGGQKIIGLSTHSTAQANSAIREMPDYIGFGPLFSTPTKPEYVAIGTSHIAEVHQNVRLPVFCIGGIKLDNIAEVLAAGAQRVVIVSGILKAKNISDYCRACLATLEQGSMQQ